MAKYFSKLAHSRWAIRKDDADMLAASSIDGQLFKADGEFNLISNITKHDNGVAVIHIDGALCFRSDFWAAIFGGDTYNSIEAAFDKCLADDDVKGIVFDINSPGGEVAGVGNLAEKIFAARGSKPLGIVAYTAGLMCSAAYWIGSACEKVVTANNGTLGSIGVLCSFAKESTKGLETIVSDLSPNKAPTPDNAEGLELIKKELNDLATVFVESVAKYRGTDFQTVLNDFGQGGVLIGKKAVEAGLADDVKTLDEVIEEMKPNQTQIGGYMADKAEKVTAEAPVTTPEATAEQKAAIIAEERARVKAIGELFTGCGLDAADAEAFIAEGKSVAEAKDFAFDKMKAMLGEQKAKLAEKDEEISALKKAAPAKNAEQNEAMKKLLEKENAGAGEIEAGASADVNEKKLAFLAGYESVMTNKKEGR